VSSRLAVAFACVALATALLAPAGAAEPVAADPDCLRRVAGLDLQTATIPQLAEAMEAKKLTSEQLVGAYLDRIAAYDAAGPKLNAVRALNPAAAQEARTLDAERAAGKVRGPLHGLPVLLKDNVATTELPITAGSVALEGAMAKRDAKLVERLRAAGAIVLGKTNLSEFAGWVDLGAAPGWSSLGGQVLNAYDLSATPSGSSSGSGVAASMAFSAATIGTETSGSILSPAMANGVVGLKPTLGAVDATGVLPLSPQFDVPGPIVRSATDAAAIFSVISGTPPAPLPSDALKGATLAYSESARDGLDAEEQTLFDGAIERARKLGATVTAVRSLDAQYVGLAEIGVIFNDFKWSLNAYLAGELRPETLKAKTLAEIIALRRGDQRAGRYGDNLLTVSDAQPGLEPVAIGTGLAARTLAQADITAALTEAGADAVLTPGNAHANIGAAAGWPTALVPAGYSGRGRTPFAVGFMGTGGEEARLLAFAHAFERDANARVAPTTVNPKLQPRPCSTGSTPAAPKRFSVAASAAGRHALRVVVRGVTGRVTLVVRRGSRVVRTVRTRARAGVARVTVRKLRRGRYTVVARAEGPPRTARSKAVRVR
jgi:amidase